MPRAFDSIPLKFALCQRTAQVRTYLADAVDFTFAPRQQLTDAVYRCAMRLTVIQFGFGYYLSPSFELVIAGGMVDADLFAVDQLAPEVGHVAADTKPARRTRVRRSSRCVFC